MKIWKVKIYSKYSLKISYLQSLKRIIFALIGGHFLLIFNSESLQDKLSKTYLERCDQIGVWFFTNFQNKKYPNNINTPIDIRTDNNAGIFNIKLTLIRILDITKYVIPNTIPIIILWL